MGSERRTRWTNEHGADGLRDKFRVYAAKDERPGSPPGVAAYFTRDRLGATGEFVFVLRPESDEAAYYALREYVVCVASRAPQLADDIKAQLDRIHKEHDAQLRHVLKEHDAQLRHVLKEHKEQRS